MDDEAVGRKVNRVHRPRHSWPQACLAAMLIAVLACLLPSLLILCLQPLKALCLQISGP
jgi:hypothetical protein